MLGKFSWILMWRCVIAIIITIMVLELKVPHGATLDVLLTLTPVLLSYVLRFIYIGIYWNKLQFANNPLNGWNTRRFQRLMRWLPTVSWAEINLDDQ